MVAIRYLVTAAVTLATPIVAQLEQIGIVDEIRRFTAQIRRIEFRAQGITTFNGPLITTNRGPFPEIISIFEKLTELVIDDLGEMLQDEEIPAGDDSAEVEDEFRRFTNRQVAAMNTLTEKAGLFKFSPTIGTPVVDALSQNADAIGGFATRLTELLTDENSGRVQRLAGIVDEYYKKAIEAYQGLTVEEPSTR